MQKWTIKGQIKLNIGVDDVCINKDDLLEANKTFVFLVVTLNKNQILTVASR